MSVSYTHLDVYKRQAASSSSLTGETVMMGRMAAAVGKLTAEYGRIGGNLNQIARTLNEWHSPDVYKRQGQPCFYAMAMDFIRFH